VIPCKYPYKLYLSSPDTRIIVLADAEICMIVSSFVWKNTGMWQKNGQTDRSPLAIG